MIKDLHEELKAWGHPGGGDNKIIMKSDGERSIVAIREALARYHGGQVTPEQPPKGESQANGVVEGAGKILRGFVRVVKDAMEDRAKIKIESQDVILQWLVRWVAMAHSRFSVGSDGKTAYERQTGKKCKMEVVPFGEKVMYKRLDDKGDKNNKLESNWEDGIWLGHARRSNEVIIGTKEGAVRAWAVRRRAEGDRWDGELMKQIRGTPQPDPNTEGLKFQYAWRSRR